MLRSVSVTNSSSSFPVWSDMPITMLPAACAGLRSPADPPSVYAGGFRNPSRSEMSLLDPFGFVREIVSVSMEWPNR